MYFIITSLALFWSVASVLGKQTTYMIRHGEKPADSNVTGLSSEGKARAQCLSELFVPPAYNIGKIIAETPKSSGKRDRPYLTVLPLSKVLGLEVDTSCSRDNSDCVASLVSDYESQKTGKAILICWEHGQLTDIAKAIGVKHAPSLILFGTYKVNMLYPPRRKIAQA